MNIHPIDPYSNPNEGMAYVTWQKVFTDDELFNIEKIGDSLPFNDAGIVIGIDDVAKDKNMRISSTSWIDKVYNTEWLYNKIGDTVRRINGEFYRFDIDGLYEKMQYTVYRSENKGFYDWHTDIGVYSTVSVTRKLSVVMVLNDPSEYEGGDLQLWGSTGFMTIPRERGMIIVFPSYVLHKVTPVTAGIRKSLVIWVGGPAFR